MAAMAAMYARRTEKSIFIMAHLCPVLFSQRNTTANLSLTLPSDRHVNLDMLSRDGLGSFGKEILAKRDAKKAQPNPAMTSMP